MSTPALLTAETLTPVKKINIVKSPTMAKDEVKNMSTTPDIAAIV